MKSVYSAVRTGALNKSVCGLSVKGQYKLKSSKLQNRVRVHSNDQTFSAVSEHNAHLL
jgi:hypothetical protein